MLGGVYYYWGIIRLIMCTTDNRYDFDEYFAKQDACLTKYPMTATKIMNPPIGPWIAPVGDASRESMEKYLEAAARTVKHVSRCFNGTMMGEDDAARGELRFFQNDFAAAEIHFAEGLKKAREHRQFDVVQRILCYLMRLALVQGDLRKASQALKDMEAQLYEDDYEHRYVT
jgi:hypothetical protein